MLPLIRPNLTLTDIASALLAKESVEARFCAELADHFGARSVQIVRSARWALFSALKAFGVGPGDEVVVPALCCASVPFAILEAGAQPVFCDVGRGTIQMSVGSVECVTSPKTKAVIAVHPFGFPAPVRELAALCRERGCWLIEDCAPCLGTTVGGRLCGTWGDVALLSFGMSKPIGTPGGGALIVRSEAALARSYEACSPATWTATLHSLAEAVGAAVSLHPCLYGFVDHMVRRREQVGSKHLRGFEGANPAVRTALTYRQWQRYGAAANDRKSNAELLTRSLHDRLSLAVEVADADVVPLFLPVRTPRVGKLQSSLEAAGFRTQTLPAYGFGPLPRKRSFRRFRAEWAEAVRAADQCLLLPLHLSLAQTRRLAESLRLAALPTA